MTGGIAGLGLYGIVAPFGGDSIITQQMWYMHWVMDSDVPEIVTALSVELGNISLATWMDAPVTSRISLILEPPFPMRDPHWLAGTMSRNVIGGLGTPPLFGGF